MAVAEEGHWIDSTSARVYLWAHPVLNLDEVERFLDDEGLEWRRTPDAGPAEETVELAGRVCYMSFGDRQSPRTNAEYIANLIARGHGSVLEHATWTVAITGVSRAFTHQLVRHRAGFSYSQLSQQYHDERDMHPVVPQEIRNNLELRATWDKAVETTKRAYVEIIERLEAEGRRPGEDSREAIRRARSTARSILPEATTTSIVVTANARSWRHFLSLRGAVVGDHEMRFVSALLFRVLVPTAPSLFQDFELIIGEDALPLVVRSDAVGNQGRGAQPEPASEAPPH